MKVSRKQFYSSDIQVLRRLLNENEPEVVVYDPDNLLIMDEATPINRASNHKMLHEQVLAIGSEAYCLINLSTENMPGLNPAWVIGFFHDKNQLLICRKWDFICNPTGTIRWIYPHAIRKPWFLGFYNFTYWKASLYKVIVKTTFALGLKSILKKGSLFIQSKEEVFAERLMKENGAAVNQYAIFTGTAGPNRKIIMAAAAQGKISRFCKIPISRQSQENVLNEFNAIRSLKTISFKNVFVPGAEWQEGKVLSLENIRPMRPHTLYRFSTEHAGFLDQLYSGDLVRRRYAELSFSEDLKQRLERIRHHKKLSTTLYAPELLKKLDYLEKQFSEENPMLAVSRNHGDFTRWNSYLYKNRVYVYDWEMSRDEMPLLYDLFHFEIQVAVFSVFADLAEVNQRLYETLTKSFVKLLVDKYRLDPVLYLRLYLLIHAAYYLEVYLNQYLLAREDIMLLKTWNFLIYTQTEYMDSYSHRKHFIDEMFKFLDDKTYVVLKNTGKDILDPSLASDIDLLIQKQDLKEIMDRIKKAPDLQKWTCVEKSFMVTVRLFFMDNSFLSLDLLHAFHRKSIEYIDAERALKHTVRRNGIKVLTPTYDYLYIFLFYQINYADVPEKYAKHFTDLSLENEHRVLSLLKNKIGIDPYYLPHTFPFSVTNRVKILSYLKSKKENNIFKRTIRFFQYCKNVWIDLAQNKGVVLTFSGVDGAGKSTILQEVRQMLEVKYRRKVVVIRHRPSIFPILSAWKYGKEAAEQRCVDSLPRKGNNKSKISSLLRFGYYYLDYIIGQAIVYARYTLRGYIVLYDRYYFDFIVDGKRSNILVNKGFIQQLYRFVFKPELNIFLYASPEVILKRKKELSADDIVQLTSNYKDLFRQLGDNDQYLCIENIDKSDTLNEIERAFIELN